MCGLDVSASCSEWSRPVACGLLHDVGEAPRDQRGCSSAPESREYADDESARAGRCASFVDSRNPALISRVMSSPIRGTHQYPISIFARTENSSGPRTGAPYLSTDDRSSHDLLDRSTPRLQRDARRLRVNFAAAKFRYEPDTARRVRNLDREDLSKPACR